MLYAKAMKNTSIVIFLAALSLVSPPLLKAQQTTSNSQAGNVNRLTVTVSNQSGVQSSASMTPDFDVETSAKLIVGKNSSSSQNLTDPTANLLTTGNTAGSSASSAAGSVSGAGSSTVLNYGEGSEYSVKITPRNLGEGESRSPYASASGSAVGVMTNSVTIESTTSSFLSSFSSSF